MGGETNDALALAWKSQREAKRAWSDTSEAAEDARNPFFTVYGEDRARLALPRFPRVGKKKG